MWDASDMLRWAEPKPIDHVLKLFARSLPLAAPLCSDTWSPWSISYLIHQPMLDCNSGSIKAASVHHSVQSQIIRLHDIDCTVAAVLQFLEIHSLWIQLIVKKWCNLQDQQGSNAHTHKHTQNELDFRASHSGGWNFADGKCWGPSQRWWWWWWWWLS